MDTLRLQLFQSLLDSSKPVFLKYLFRRSFFIECYWYFYNHESKLLTYPQQKSSLLRRQNFPNACLDQNLEQQDRMNLTTVLKTVPLSAKLASANTFVNFASISSSLCMVIFTSFYRTQVRSLPCLVSHSACKSSLWDLTDVTLACKDSRNLCLPYPLLSLLTTMLLMSEHNALPCLVMLLWFECRSCYVVQSSNESYQQLMHVTEVCSRFVSFSLVKLLKLNFFSRVWSWNFVMNLKLNLCQNWCRNYESFIR